MKNTYLIILFAILFVQCTENNIITLKYDLTYCADKWEMNNDLSLEEQEEIIKTYLKEEEKIVVDGLNLLEKVNTPEACNACSCKTGDVIQVKIEEGFELQLVELGFYP